MQSLSTIKKAELTTVLAPPPFLVTDIQRRDGVSNRAVGEEAEQQQQPKEQEQLASNTAGRVGWVGL